MGSCVWNFWAQPCILQCLKMVYWQLKRAQRFPPSWMWRCLQNFGIRTLVLYSIALLYTVLGLFYQWTIKIINSRNTDINFVYVCAVFILHCHFTRHNWGYNKIYKKSGRGLNIWFEFITFSISMDVKSKILLKSSHEF